MRRTGIKLGLIVALGAFLLSFRLGANDFFLDEVMGLGIAMGSPADVVRQAMGDVHPPLHFLILNAWTGPWGVSEVTARTPSVVFAVLTIAMAYLLARRAFPEEAALLSALLVAASPYIILYGRLARYYSLLTFLYLLSVFLLERACRRRTAGPWAAYAASTAALLYTNYAGLFALPAAALYAAWKGKKCLSRYLAALACILVMFLPLVPWMAAQSRRFGAAAGPVGGVELAVDICAKVAFSLYALCLGETVSIWNVAVIIPALALMVFLLARGLGGAPFSGGEGRRMWICFYAVPLLCAAGVSSLPFVGVFSAKSVALFPARAVMLAPIAYMAVANGLSRLPPRGRLALGAAAGAVFAYSLVNLYAGREYLNEKYVSPWREVAEFVAGKAGGSAFVASREPAFWYYYRGGEIAEIGPEGEGKVAEGKPRVVWIVERMRGDTTLGRMTELGPAFFTDYRLRATHAFQPLDERKREIYARLRGREVGDHYIEVSVYERVAGE